MFLSFVFGWGAGIRTPEMSESESDALPLGDTPIFRTRDIIADEFLFVNPFLKKTFLSNEIFSKTLPISPPYGIIFPLRHPFIPHFLPVAQLDSASDSDSEGRRFESFRVGQKPSPPYGGGGFCLPQRFELKETNGRQIPQALPFPLVFFPHRPADVGNHFRVGQNKKGRGYFRRSRIPFRECKTLL